MAGKLWEGFDAFTSNSQLGSTDFSLYGAGGRSIVTGFLGTGKAIRFDPLSSEDAGVVLPLNSEITTDRVVLHFHFRQNGSPSTNSLEEILYVRNSSNQTIFNLAVDLDGSDFYVRRGSTALLTLSSFLTNGVGGHVIVDVVLSDTVGTVTVYRDGVQIATLGSLDTRNVAGNPHNIVILQTAHAQAVTIDFDNIYVDDAAVKGQVEVVTKPVTADVGTPDWTASSGTDRSAMLDEVPTDGDTTYVHSSADADIVRMEVDHGLSGVTILGVQLLHMSRAEAASSDEIIAKLHAGATTDAGTTKAVTTGYRAYKGVGHAVNPDTTVAWTTSDPIEVSLEHNIP